MFDEQPFNPTQQPPNNLPTAPDMFEGIEKDESATPPNALQSGMLKKKEPAATVPTQTIPQLQKPLDSMPLPEPPVLPTGGGSFAGKFFGILVALAVLGGLGFGGWMAYQKFVKSGKTTPGNIVVNQNTPADKIPEKIVTTTPAQNQSNNILFGDADSDKDGLSDAEEKQYGTNPQNPDTDGDGLSDGDEVRIWGTDPLKADTDGDGYNDAVEIMNGFNPKGAGRFTPPYQVVQFVSSTNSSASSSPATDWTYKLFVIKTGN